MSSLDISMVLYRPDIAALSRTLDSLAAVSSEFGTLRILVSGSRAERKSVGLALDSRGIRYHLTHRYDNLGFASGHNLLLSLSRGSAASGCLILNPDVSFEPFALREFVRTLPFVGLNLVGPRLMRAEVDGSRTDIVDSGGIVWTRSGRHFDRGHGRSVPEVQSESSSEIFGVSGACLYVGWGAYDLIVGACGYFFDDVFLAYREDAELGIRARALGVRSVILDIDGFYHVRSVRGSKRGHHLQDLLGVRNRFVLRARLGGFRPGGALPAVRDLVVIVATVLVERTSIAGLLSAMRMRRFLRYTSPLRGWRPRM